MWQDDLKVEFVDSSNSFFQLPQLQGTSRRVREANILSWFGSAMFFPVGIHGDDESRTPLKWKTAGT